MINKKFTYTTVLAAFAVVLGSTAFAQFSLTNGGSGMGYGYGFGYGYGSDLGQCSYRTTGGAASNYAYGYGIVTDCTNVVSGGGGGGGTGGGYAGGGYTTGSTGTTGTGANGQPLTCAPHFIKYMRINKVNSTSEVKKLQSFLNKYEGGNIPVVGRFGSRTDSAVKAFQKKYAVSPVSGYVYVKTLAKLNEIYCSKVSAK
jgi:hypothetical protein